MRPFVARGSPDRGVEGREPSGNPWNPWNLDKSERRFPEVPPEDLQRIRPKPPVDDARIDRAEVRFVRDVGAVVLERGIAAGGVERSRRAVESAVHGGLYGTAASLNPAGGNPTLENNGADVTYETDFRSVYARVIDGWLGANSLQILGGDFRKSTLGFI